MDIRERLLAAFQVEYQEHLEVIRKLLAEMLARADGGSGIGQLDEIFRRAHSLKGAARAVDLGPVEQLAHRLETLFARLRTGHTKFDPLVASLVMRTLDMVEDWVAAFAGGQNPPDIAPSLAKLEAFLETGAVEAPSAPVAPVITVPAELEAAIAAAASPPEPAVEAAPEPPRAAIAAEESVRVRAIHLDRLLRTSDELLTETMNQRAVTEGLMVLDRQLGESEGVWLRYRKLAAALAHDHGDDDRVTALGRMGEELEQRFRQMARRARDSRRRQQRNGWALRQLGVEFQQEVRDARMVPAESVFAGFRKMVRDIARDAGKLVEVQVGGLDVEADRMVLQGLKDPVMHCCAIVWPTASRDRRNARPAASRSMP